MTVAWINAEEIGAIIGRVAPVILSTVPSKRGTTAADLRSAVGKLISQPIYSSDPEAFAVQFMTCVDLARTSGATVLTMSLVRKAALLETPVSVEAATAVQTMILLTLAQEARLVADLTFTSREDAATMSATMTDAFNEAAEAAADSNQAGVYMATITLQARVIKHLSDQGRELPRIITYRFAETMPAPTLSNRVYGTGERYLELAKENKVIHPAFMPSTGRMLAV